MNFLLISPEILLVCLAVFLVVLDLLLPDRETRSSIGYLAVFGLTGIMLVVINQFGAAGTFYADMYQLDRYAAFFKILFLAAVSLTLLFSFDYVDRLPRHVGEFYAMIVFSVLGMMMLASANDLITFFVGMGVMNVSFYILVGYHFNDGRSGEAGVKYLVLSAASSAVMLYGLSLIYGYTGSVTFEGIIQAVRPVPAMLAGCAMVLIGLGFKIAAVPFHMWSPDIYEGAPVPVTALLAICSKMAAFAVLLRILLQAVPALAGMWLPVIVALAAVSMIVGNVIAMNQSNIKRLLAYSSIAQAGYLLCGLVAANAAGIKGILFYGMLYVFANVGAFAVITAVKMHTGAEDIEAFSGLSRKAPLLAVVMTVSLLSMAGIPPMAGFAGKLYLFLAVVDQGYLWLALLGFVMSMISVYYYLLVAKAMYWGEAKDWHSYSVSTSLTCTAMLSLVATLLLGIYPGPLADLASMAAASLF
ncbi:NADH-quinone oxidoreductase subunit N [Propionispora sp. 2/2-37]|uniref:NADH-quinone oxidoreductase subunit N n=1 Tax=Propionispora sp. 2/2-37 TaxID=1677858 RepID=UPI0006BB8DBE|nr:NADH-quinone oxidoreductase subunit N [Propionispora sp. 2/2-37]